MTERLPTYAIEAITDAANLLMKMRRWAFVQGTPPGDQSVLETFYDSYARIGPTIDNLNQIIDGQAALRKPWSQPEDVQDLPFAMGETS